jgi:hypothetical protein
MDPVPVVSMRRRSFLAAAAGAIAFGSAPAFGRLSASHSGGATLLQGVVVPSPDIDISYGQSNMSNNFASIGELGFNPEQGTVLGLKTSAMPGTLTPGPLSTSGILLAEWQRIIGVTSYTSSDAISVGRAAALAEQLIRVAKGVVTTPILEMNHAYPGCTWLSCQNPDGGGLHPGSTPWTCLQTGITKIASFPNTILKSPRYRSVAYYQGGSDPDNLVQKDIDLSAMFSSYDALGVMPANFPIFFIFQGALANQTDFNNAPSLYELVPNVRSNANNRSWMVTPIYAWPYLGDANTHSGRYGSCRAGEFLAYARWVYYGERAAAYYPLQLSRSGSITVYGQIITIPFDRPSGRDFAGATLSFQNDPSDGIKDWPQKGFHVRRNGIDLAVLAAISSLNVQLSITETLSPGDVLEVSYAYYGPGGPNPGPCSGVGGNLCMIGPASVLFPSAPPPGNTINAWAMPFKSTVTV